MTQPIYIGRFVGTHGISGELKLGNALRWFDGNQTFSMMYVGKTCEKTEEKSLISQRWHKNRYLLRFTGIENLEEAKKMIGFHAYSDELLQSKLGEYFVMDLVGLRVLNEKRHNFGVVESVYFVGDKSILAIRDFENREVLIPMNAQFVTGVSLNSEEIFCQNIEGLWECA